LGLVALLIVTFAGGRFLPHSLSVALAWPGYLWLAVMFYLLVVLVVLEVPALVARLVMRTTKPSMVSELVSVGAGSVGAPPAPLEETPANGETRRLFLGRAVAITAGVTAVGLVGSGVGSALGMPELKRIQIPLARLPRGADGLRIALVSDIHLGPLNGLSRTRRIVEMVNGLGPDLVAVVGDLVDGSVAELGPAAAPMADLRSRLGTFFVTGNHEYYSGYREWIDEVRRLGMRPLRNERVELPGGLDLAGVNDLTGDGFGDGPDVGRALLGRDPSRPVVLLAHQPVQAHDAARHGVDLQLSGHTHGGQMVPFNLIVRAAQQPVVSGLGEVDGMPVYVTNGAGFWGPPVRVGAPPDVTLVELHAP
jgi:predicted MPP superfamily phosphohydrolase